MRCVLVRLRKNAPGMYLIEKQNQSNVKKNAMFICRNQESVVELMSFQASRSRKLQYTIPDATMVSSNFQRNVEVPATTEGASPSWQHQDGRRASQRGLVTRQTGFKKHSGSIREPREQNSPGWSSGGILSFESLLARKGWHYTRQRRDEGRHCRAGGKHKINRDPR